MMDSWAFLPGKKSEVVPTHFMKTCCRSREIAELYALRGDCIDDLLKNAYQTENR
jgi:hypothetical protein